MRKIIGIFIVTLLIATVLPLVSGDNPVLLKTIIVPDDYPTIQKAINNANDEDTIIVRAGTYYENLVVDKSIILSGENRDTTIIDGGENSDVVFVSADYVTITGFTVTNSATSGFFYSGINLNDSSNINISGNIILNNMRGINVIFTENSVIHDNIFINDGIVVDGGCKFDFDHDIQGNTVNGKPLYYYKYKNDFTVPTDAGQVILYNCDNVMIKDMKIDNTDCAIQLNYCDGCVIKDSYLSNIDVYGIMVDYTNRLTIQENNLNSGGSFGIIISNSGDCIVENNTLTGNTWVGISLYIGCLDSVISDNNIELNISSSIFDFSSIGIWIRYYCNFNNFIGNKISNCQIGLWMESSDQNTIERNLIEECHIATTQQTETSINDLIVKIGKNVSIGHGAIVHGAIIEDDCLIGMNVTILNGAKLGRGSVIGANALVKNNMDVPENSLVLGIPGKIVKHDEKFREMARLNAETYQKLSKEHLEGKHPIYNSTE